MVDFKLAPETTSLVLIDLQLGTLRGQLAPYSANDVVKRCASLAASFRAQRALVAYLRVDLQDMLHLPTDRSTGDPNAPILPASASELVPECGYQESDLLITKRQWGAFYGTELDQQLRRHGIKTIVLGGVATNAGVESTARAAFDMGYEVVFAEDAMSSFTTEMHRFAVQHIFGLMGRVRQSSEIVEALVE
ncbi:MAG: isochorismatase family protein [Brasilonema angustatum HA4187-MV1]|jgi:nicotinamidase-related amidase|nr:isochorismatase family protein [Brasilonema angustatum HA4187-MV1]